MKTLAIERMDGAGRIVVHDLSAVLAAYYRAPATRANGAPNGYDDPDRTTQVHQITRDDIRAANALAAHIRGDDWQGIVDGSKEIRWLAALPHDVDASLASADEWRTHRSAIAHAIGYMSRSRPRAAGITKVLHLKRPRLVPLVDAIVREQLGAPDGADGVGEPLLALIEHLVRQSDRNGQVLDAAIASFSDATGLPRISRLRALDIAIWASHPRSAGPTGIHLVTTVGVAGGAG